MAQNMPPAPSAEEPKPTVPSIMTCGVMEMRKQDTPQQAATRRVLRSFLRSQKLSGSRKDTKRDRRPIVQPNGVQNENGSVT